MTQEVTRLTRIPTTFILLAIVGTLCLVLGLYEYFSAGHGLFPETLRFQYYEITLMLIGGLLMLPLLTLLLEFIRYGREQRSPNK